MWVLSPQRRDTMSAYYQHLAHVVATEQRAEWLLYAYNDMWTFLAAETLVPGERAQSACLTGTTMLPEELRTVLHRMSCHLLRYIAAIPPCLAPCCCDCPAAYAKISCVGRLPDAY